MKQTTQLAQRLKEVLTEGKWVTGTNLQEQVVDLDWDQATHKIGPLHSIAEIIFHIDYYLAGVIHVLQGRDLEIRDKYSFQVPPIRSGKDWKKLTDKLFSDAVDMIALVENLSEEDLGKTFAEEKYGNYQRNIDVMIEHCYYHLGQIILIKKLMNSKN